MSLSDQESVIPREDSDHPADFRRTDRRWWLAVAVLALAGAGLVLVSTARYGAGLTPDSVDYLDVARNLVSGKGLVFHTGEPLVWWPPLYPMLLALIGFATRLDPAAFVHFANAVLSALVIFLSARLYRNGFQHDDTYSLLGVCAVLLSVPLSRVYVMAWSEALFIPLVLLYLLFAQRYRRDAGIPSLAVMTLATALACVTRYIGIAVVPAGVLTIVLASGVSLKKRVVRAGAFVVLSLAPLGCWAARNYHLTETLFGGRGAVRLTLVRSATISAETMVLWFVPRYGAKFTVLAGAAFALVMLVGFRAARGRALTSLRAVMRTHSPALLLLAAYLIALLGAAMRDAYIDSRMLSPMYVPLLFVLLALGLHLFGPIRRDAAAVRSRMPVVLLALWLCFPLTSLALSTARRFKDGAGCYSERVWRESETVAYARQMLALSPSVSVYSNGPDVLWELARLNATRSPSRSTVSLSDLESRWPAGNGSVLVWFNNITWRQSLFTAEELGEISDVEEVEHFSDGSIYRVSRREIALHAPNCQSSRVLEKIPPPEEPAR